MVLSLCPNFVLVMTLAKDACRRMVCCADGDIGTKVGLGKNGRALMLSGIVQKN